MDATLASTTEGCSVEESYAHCERLAKTHYENFTVVSRALPREKRKHFYSIYAFCRFVDDLGDEYEGDRLKALDLWERELDRCYSGAASHRYTVALQETIGTFDIPREPFSKLIEANRIDQRAKRYPCLLYTSPSPRDGLLSRMPSSA